MVFNYNEAVNRWLWMATLLPKVSGGILRLQLTVKVRNYLFLREIAVLCYNRKLSKMPAKD